MNYHDTLKGLRHMQRTSSGAAVERTTALFAPVRRDVVGGSARTERVMCPGMPGLRRQP